MQQHFLRRKLRQFHFILKRIQAHRSGKTTLNEEILQQLYAKAKLLFKKVKSRLSFADLRKVAGIFGMAFLMSQSPLQAQSFAPPEINPFGLDVLFEEELLFSFVDIDDDGDLDILGTKSFYGDYGLLDSIRYRLCENVGTPENPQFTAPTNFSEQEAVRAAGFVDFDGDGDFDALSILTDYDSDSQLFSLQYAENTGSPALAEFAAEQDNNPIGLDFSDTVYYFIFDAVDMDDDGDLDMVGTVYSYEDNETEISLRYFENSGSVTSPDFDGDNPIEIGLELPTDIGYIYLSTADLDNDGDVDILLAGYYYDYDSETYGTKVYFTENIGTPDSPQFADPVENTFLLEDYNEVESAFPFTEDIDNDGDEDVFFWEYIEDEGYQMIYQENTSTVSVTETHLEVKVTPNPSNDLVFFASDMNVESVSITDLAGKVIEQQRVVNQSVSIRDLPRGMYILHSKLEDGRMAVARVVKE